MCVLDDEVSCLSSCFPFLLFVRCMSTSTVPFFSSVHRDYKGPSIPLTGLGIHIDTEGVRCDRCHRGLCPYCKGWSIRDAK